jgi:hypothetical protein
MGLFSANTTMTSDRSTTPTLRRTGNSPSSSDDIISPLLADASSTGSDDTSSSSENGMMMFKDVEMNAVPAAKTTTTSSNSTTVTLALHNSMGGGGGHHHHNVLKHKNSNLNLEHVANAAAAKSSSEPAKALWACGLYSFCSVSMILVNKSLASRYVSIRFPSLVECLLACLLAFDTTVAVSHAW